MKHIISTLILALVAIVASAQSTNPLNYSGRMYIEAMDVISTPRYISYEDHAILSTDMHIPSIEITPCILDFENGVITVNDVKMNVSVNATKKYTMDYGWEVVVYMELVGRGDKVEFIWPEYGNPYLQQITKTDDGVKIARMILSREP